MQEASSQFAAASVPAAQMDGPAMAAGIDAAAFEVDQQILDDLIQAAMDGDIDAVLDLLDDLLADLQAKLDDLKAELDALEAEIAAIEA